MSNQEDNNYHEDSRYVYRRDAQGRIHRYQKGDYRPRPGFYRLRFLERPYFWWRFKSFDFKNALIPIGLSFVYAFVVFNASMELSQREVEMEIKARLPEQFSKKGYQEYRKNRLRQGSQVLPGEESTPELPMPASTDSARRPV